MKLGWPLEFYFSSGRFTQGPPAARLPAPAGPAILGGWRTTPPPRRQESADGRLQDRLRALGLVRGARPRGFRVRPDEPMGAGFWQELVWSAEGRPGADVWRVAIVGSVAGTASWGLGVGAEGF